MIDLPLRSSRYGWIPDLPDQRDFSYISLAAVIPALPPKIDLRSFCTPVENQETLGSCTACSLVGNLEFLKKKNMKKIINFSKLFLYYNERLIRNTVNVDSGASLRDGIKTLIRAGDCLESLWPYNIKIFTKKPDEKAYSNAKNYQIKSYYRINTLSEMKHTLSKNYPFVFGFAVYESFESKKVAETGIVPYPKIGERLLGGHAVMAVGYNEKEKYFIIRNSWGKSWGLDGYFYMPYDYLSNSNLSSDFWTIRDME